MSKKNKSVEQTHPWRVTADYCDGRLPRYEVRADNEPEALKHAAWLTGVSGLMNVELTGPAYAGPVTLPTAADISIGETLMDLLENSRICPAARYKINQWCDSKAWG